MKKMAFSLAALLLLFACNNASDETTATNQEDTTVTTMAAGPTDTAQARKDLAAILDSIRISYGRKDPSYMDKYLAKDGIYMGSDPSEIQNFEQHRNYQAQSFQDTTIKDFTLNLVDRFIYIHGASANLVEQFYAQGLSRKLMFRTVSHARYENGRWILDMLTYNIVPKNEDFFKMDKVL